MEGFILANEVDSKGIMNPPVNLLKSGNQRWGGRFCFLQTK